MCCLWLCSMTFVSSFCKNLTLSNLPPSPQCGTVAVLELPFSPSASWSHWCWSRQPSWPAEPLPPQGSPCASLGYVSAVPRYRERGCQQIRIIKKTVWKLQILPVVECVAKTNYDCITKTVNESVERRMSLPISILSQCSENEYPAKVAIHISKYCSATSSRTLQMD